MVLTNEVYQLLIAVVLAPLIIHGLLSVQLPGVRSIAVGVSAVAFAYVFTVLEGLSAQGLFNLIEHIMYAVAGIAFLVSSIQGARFWHYRGGEGG